jgi:hypothetical protein
MGFKEIAVFCKFLGINLENKANKAPNVFPQINSTETIPFWTWKLKQIQIVAAIFANSTT